jgi:DNA modification methylase
LKPKDLIGVPWRVAFALQEFGWYLRQDIIWHKPNPMPESVKDRCTKNHEYIFLLSKKSKYYFDHLAIQEPVKEDWGTRDRSKGKYHNEGTGLNPHGGLEKSYEMANKRSVWTVTTKPFHGAHFAVYPPELIEPCVLASTKIGDIVLDPFMGSGTTAAVSERLNRQYIGCELNPEYEKLQKERLKQPSLELL